MTVKTKLPADQPLPDPVADLITLPESLFVETKRLSGKMVHKALETIVAFANTEGERPHPGHGGHPEGSRD